MEVEVRWLECVEIVADTIATLTSLGAEIVDPVENDKDGMSDAQREILYYEFKADLNGYLEKSGALIERIADISDAKLIQFARYRQEFVEDLYLSITWYSSYDSTPPQSAVAKQDYGVVTSLEYHW